jgi:hypothetical protein
MSKKLIFQMIIWFISLLVFEAYARRVKMYPLESEEFPLIVYSSKGGMLIPVWYRQERFLFRTGIFEQAKGVALWIEQKRKQGLISKIPTLVVLSSFLDCHPELYSDDNYNWLAYLFRKELLREAFVVFPESISQNHPEWLNAHRKIAEDIQQEYGYKITVLDTLDGLPDGEKLRDVILVIDCSYFANKVLVEHPAEMGKLVFQIINLHRVLERNRIRVKAMLLIPSPDYVGQEEAEAILEQLLEVFANR